MLQKLRPVSSPIDHLFVGTDRNTYFTVSWDPSIKQLKTENSYVDLADKTGRDSQSLDRCLIDPERKFLVLEIFEGILTVLPMFYVKMGKGGEMMDVEVGTPGEPITVRIPELFVRSSAFLHPRIPPVTKDNKARLVLLCDDGDEKAKVKIRSLTYGPEGVGEQGYADFDEEQRVPITPDPSASHLIPVPAPACESKDTQAKPHLTAYRWLFHTGGNLYHICGRRLISDHCGTSETSYHLCYMDTNRLSKVAFGRRLWISLLSYDRFRRRLC